MNTLRVRILQEGQIRKGPVVYWMSRDQRTRDNWALLYAQELALQKQTSLCVIFCLVPSFLNAAIRQYAFMLKGLCEVAETLQSKNIHFILLQGDPENEIPVFIEKHQASVLTTDFDPLNIKSGWKKKVAERIRIPFYEIDTHNIIPCWIASSKQEYAARTIRPKIHKLLLEFLEPFPQIKKHPVPFKKKSSDYDWKQIIQSLSVDKHIPEVNWITPGEKAAKSQLQIFIRNKLQYYDQARNDPTKQGQSDLSPYFHFGQLSAQRTALDVTIANAPDKDKDAFLEQLIIRRELTDNYCHYNKNYDHFKGLPQWCQNTLNQHREDPRTFNYSEKQFEESATHDALWNAAQMEMVKRGKMHGYMRMYWAKKILEWSQTPEDAFAVALYLNDKYSLDGRDPNGYVGVAWAIGGVHDRPWQERSVFGKIRYMNFNGCKRKFNVKKYCSDWI